ncbi:MAG: TrmH family RNA methyltransferase [Myxococcota bacterium]
MRRQLHDAAALADALASGAPVRLVLHRSGPLSADAVAALALAEARGIECRVISQNQLTRLCQARLEPELLALVGPDPRRSLEEVAARARAVWLLVDTAYPGNAGFVIRTAEVSGADAVVVAAAFDHEQRRAVRRTAMRADRYMPVIYTGAEAAIDAARAAGLQIVGIEDSGTVAPWDADLARPSLFAVGGERDGIPPGLLARCDLVVRLPMGGFVPSYNLQAAMAMVAGERLRQLATRAPALPPERPEDRPRGRPDADSHR